MRRRTVGLIARKELLDTLRDRRTLFIALVLPLLLYPALLLGLTQVVGATQRNLDAERQRVLVDGIDAAHPLFERLRARQLEPEAGGGAALAARLRDLAAGAEEDEAARAALRETLQGGGLAGAVLFEPGFAAALAADRRGAVRLLFDPTDEPSKFARAKAKAVLEEFARERREAFVAGHAADEARLRFVERPVEVRELEVASRSQKGAYSFAPMLGMLIVLMALTGAFYPAVDLVAGEKERGTMETLLVTPLSRGEIVVGKFLAIWLVAVVTALLNLAVMGVTFSKLAGMAGAGTIAFTPPAGAFLGVTAILVPTAALFSAVALALSSFATSYKEGQHYLSPLFLVASPLAMVGLLPGVEIGYGLALVPVANVVLLVKAMLLGGGGGTAGPAVVATAVMALFAAAALFAAVALFRREGVLFRVGGGRGYDAAAFLAKRAGIPGEGRAVLLYFTVLALMFYLAARPPASLAGVVRVFVLSQLAAVLAPTALFALRSRVDLRRTFSLRPLAPAHALLVPFAAAFALVVVLVAQKTLLPERDAQGIEALVAALAEGPLWLGLLLLAVLPPICEEALCRGFLLASFRARYGDGRAVLVTAVLFGALHLDLHRFPATAAAGLVLGLLCVRTGSILASLLFHAVYNGILALTLYAPPVERALDAALQPGVAGASALLAAAGLGGTLWFLLRRPAAAV